MLFKTQFDKPLNKQSNSNEPISAIRVLGLKSHYYKNFSHSCFDDGYVGKQPVAWKEYCAEYWLKGPQESMDRCSGHRDITEILLKTALNTIESISYKNTDYR